MVFKIDNRNMRHLWLDANHLASSHDIPLDILQIIKNLGFIQLDSIQNVSRAHHHILWSRNSGYNEAMFDQLLCSKQDIFEHFTHDASVIPMEFYPMWRRQFRRMEKKMSKYYDLSDLEFWQNQIISKITNDGAVSTRDFKSKINTDKKIWSRPPHKRILEYLWYSGELSTSHREKFIKFYDMAKNVIPKKILNKNHTDMQQIDWLCGAALNRLAVATAKEIKSFWDATNIDEVKSWLDKNSNKLTAIEWQAADGSYIKSFAFNNIKKRVNDLAPLTNQIRIINPFDPLVRDRKRLKNIFNIDYKIEIFLPKKKRKWGYYVYLLLYGDKFIGRIEAKADRKTGILNIINFWPENDIEWNKSHRDGLDIELLKFAKLANLNKVNWLNQINMS